MQAIDRSSAEHYHWGNAGDGWHLVKRADMSVISERVPPGASEVRHFHASARQFFYILIRLHHYGNKRQTHPIRIWS